MKKDRVTLTIDPDVRARLERTGNASSYISRTIRERLDAAEASLRVLRIEGWKAGEVRAAADALLGFDLGRFGSDGRLVAAELERAAGDGKIPPELLTRWRSRIDAVRDNAAVSHALCVVLGELWVGNEAVEDSVERLRGVVHQGTGTTFPSVPLDVVVRDAAGEVVCGPFEVGHGQLLDLGPEPPPIPWRQEDIGRRPKRYRLAIDQVEVWGIDLDPNTGDIPWYQYELYMR